MFDRVMSHAVMPRDEERAAFERYAELRAKHGDAHKLTLAARNALVLANMRLVAKLANKLPGLTVEERIQEGVIGLITAIERFDVTRGLRFSTYAGWWVRNAIQRAVADTERTVRLPVGVQQRRARAERKGVDNSTDPLALLYAMSLDDHVACPPEDGVTTLHERLAGEAEPADEQLARAQEAQAVREGVAELEIEAGAIVSRRFGLGGGEETLKQIAAGQVSCERVRQREQEALRELRGLVA